MSTKLYFFVTGSKRNVKSPSGPFFTTFWLNWIYNGNHGKKTNKKTGVTVFWTKFFKTELNSRTDDFLTRVDFFFFIWSEWCMRWLRVSPHPGSSGRGPPRDWGTCLLFASSVAPRPRSSPWNTACTLLGDAKVNWRWLRHKAFAVGDFKSEPSSEFYSLIVLHLTSETKTPKAKAADKVSVMRIPKLSGRLILVQHYIEAHTRQQPG